MASLRATFASGRTRPARWRVEQLRGIERLASEREGEIAAALAQDLDRTAVDSLLTEVVSSRNEAAYAAKRVRRWMRPQPKLLPLILQPALGWVRSEPRGIVLIISPWNFPVALALNPLVSAIAAGNCAVIKPSELAPASSRLLARLIPQYLDPAAVTVVEGDGHATQDLIAGGVDHVVFTGGTEIGRKVMAAAAEHLTPVTLEMGGKCPAIVLRDADLAVTARRIAWTKVLNSGQTCIAADYVLVERAARDELVQQLSRAFTKFRAKDRTPGLRIVNRRQFDRLAGYLAGTKGRVAHGGVHDADALTIEPTILLDPDPGEPVMREEIFGPILPVLAVDSLTEAIDFVNARPAPLTSHLFTRSRSARQRVCAETSSGSVVVNHLMAQYQPQLPFGGVGESGLGAYKGRRGFDELSHQKSVVVKTFAPDPRVLYPPHTNLDLRILRRVS